MRRLQEIGDRYKGEATSFNPKYRAILPSSPFAIIEAPAKAEIPNFKYINLAHTEARPQTHTI